MELGLLMQLECVLQRHTIADQTTPDTTDTTPDTPPPNSRADIPLDLFIARTRTDAFQPSFPVALSSETFLPAMFSPNHSIARFPEVLNVGSDDSTSPPPKTSGFFRYTHLLLLIQFS